MNTIVIQKITNFGPNIFFLNLKKIRKNEIHKLWIERIITYIKKFKLKHKSLLEIGSGYGTFGNLVITSNFFSKYLGIEPTPELSEVCKERKLKIINKKVEDVFLEEKFDIVVSFEVIDIYLIPKYL